MVGATGTGKSTTLASMLEQRNQQMAGHILTIEDPIEFAVHQQAARWSTSARSAATRSTLQVALKNALRQAPDCILIGEIRDRETMTSAISYALSGHLVLATLHANNSYHALGRILSFYTPEVAPCAAEPTCRRACAPSCRSGCVRATAGGRMPAVEVHAQHQAGVRADRARATSRRSRRRWRSRWPRARRPSKQDLARMIGDGIITRDEGLAHADSPTNLMWRLQNDQTPIARAPVKKRRPRHRVLHRDRARRGADGPTTRSAPLTRR